MTTNNLKATIDNRIQSISVASKALFVELGAASRELLMYVPDSNDIGAVNRLLNVLNRTDRQHAVLFFDEFLPWQFDEATLLFAGKLSGERRNIEYATARNAFLKLMVKAENGKEHEATIWDWVKENVNVAERKVDFNENLKSLIGRATAEKNKDGTVNKFRITNDQVIADVLASGITIDDLMAVVDKAMAERKAAEKAAEIASKAAAAKAAKAAANANKRKAKPEEVAGANLVAH